MKAYEMVDGVELAWERKVIVEEVVPCGISVETEYFNDGKMIRKDVTVRVYEGVLSTSGVGEDPAPLLNNLEG